MNKYVRNFKSTTCSCVLEDDEQKVQNGLAYTPSDMRDMVKSGRPVAPQNLDESFFSDTDNSKPNDFSVNIWNRRGVNINDVWETQQDSRKKIQDAHSAGAFEKVNLED